MSIDKPNKDKELPENCRDCHILVDSPECTKNKIEEILNGIKKYEQSLQNMGKKSKYIGLLAFYAGVSVGLGCRMSDDVLNYVDSQVVRIGKEIGKEFVEQMVDIK